MELFIHGLIPALAIVMFCVAICFFVIPALAPGVLLLGSAAVFVVTVYIHWTQFGRDEYERATWMWNIKDYAPLVLLAMVLVACVVFYYIIQNQRQAQTLMSGGGMSEMPPLTMPQMGGGFEEIMMRAGSRINTLLKNGKLNLNH